MTEIKPDRPVRRLTASYRQNRELVITLFPSYATIKRKGMRTAYPIDYGAVFDCACKMMANAARAEKIEVRKKKGKR